MSIAQALDRFSQAFVQPNRLCFMFSAAATEELQELQSPHGGKLVNLMASAEQKAKAIEACTKSVECSDRNACDVELLTVGCVILLRPVVPQTWAQAQNQHVVGLCRAFSPLEGFMAEEEYYSVVQDWRLKVSSYDLSMQGC